MTRLAEANQGRQPERPDYRLACVTISASVSEPDPALRVDSAIRSRRAITADCSSLVSESPSLGLTRDLPRQPVRAPEDLPQLAFIHHLQDTRGVRYRQRLGYRRRGNIARFNGYRGFSRNRSVVFRSAKPLHRSSTTTHAIRAAIQRKVRHQPDKPREVADERVLPASIPC